MLGRHAIIKEFSHTLEETLEMVDLLNNREKCQELKDIVNVQIESVMSELLKTVATYKNYNKILNHVLEDIK